MRVLWAALLAGLCLISIPACSPSEPPQGRWEGAYESADTMIVARIEIDKGGVIYLSAPDALNITATDDAERELIRQRLALGLARAWSETAPRKLDFDGRIFRKPGGIAPQMEWDPSTRHMTLIIYPGTRPSVRIAMRRVEDFTPDPWPR